MGVLLQFASFGGGVTGVNGDGVIVMIIAMRLRMRMMVRRMRMRMRMRMMRMRMRMRPIASYLMRLACWSRLSRLFLKYGLMVSLQYIERPLR